MNLNKALLIAVAVLAPLDALASLQAPWIEENCPTGVFETDPDRIAATFASETAEPMLMTPATTNGSRATRCDGPARWPGLGSLCLESTRDFSYGFRTANFVVR
jgi:hypothetical protein